jgi:hypothetical protein
MSADQITIQKNSGRSTKSDTALWSVALALWFLVLCFLPCPRPLSSPDWLVRSVRTIANLPEPYARLVSALLFRSLGLFFLGGLAALAFSSFRLRAAVPLGIVLASLLAIAAMWFNYGYFPVPVQLQVGLISAVIGVLVGIGIFRSRAAIGLLVLLGGLFACWGASIGVSDELDVAARTIGSDLLEESDSIPSGDEGFVAIIHKAFAEAEESSSGMDPVFANQAAILALGVILGEEKVAKIARREIDSIYRPKIESLRNRITLRGRGDLPRHFWVSAGLTVVSSEANSTAVGKAKELMDAGPGGSGFSFVDMAANASGIRFAVLATKNEAMAKEMRQRVQQTASSFDFCPSIDGLPEGMTTDQFQSQYGGIGGEGTLKLFDEIRARVLGSPMLKDGAQLK